MIPLFATQGCWKDSGGEPSTARGKMCVVLSRPCAAEHKTWLVVGGIEKYTGGVPADVESFDDHLAFLTDMRDGAGQPDAFYLGSLPALEGRYCARFDSLHTIEFPESEVERLIFIRKHRIGKLNGEFARDLHLRIFRAFASLGFDDYSWFSTGDLDLLIAKGNQEISTADAEVHQIRSAQEKGNFGGKKVPDGPVEKAEKHVAELRAKLAPFVLERSRRSAG